MTENPVILVVEDDDDDFFLLRRTLQKAGAQRIQHVATGQDAIHYLAGSGSYADRGAHPFPSLVFLDLKMDRVSGHEVLGWMKANLRSHPAVYVLTGSDEARDRAAVKSSGVAAGYFVKPLGTPEAASLLAAARTSPGAASPRAAG